MIEFRTVNERDGDGYERRGSGYYKGVTKEDKQQTYMYVIIRLFGMKHMGENIHGFV